MGMETLKHQLPQLQLLPRLAQALQLKQAIHLPLPLLHVVHPQLLALLVLALLL